MIIFHIENDSLDVQSQIMDLLNSKGFSCSVNRVGQNSVINAYYQSATDQAGSSEAPPSQPADDGTLGSFEITDFGAQAIAIGNGIAATGDTLQIAEPVPQDAPEPEPVSVAAPIYDLPKRLVINNISTIHEIDCVNDEERLFSTLYVSRATKHPYDPNTVVAEICFSAGGPTMEVSFVCNDTATCCNASAISDAAIRDSDYLVRVSCKDPLYPNVDHSIALILVCESELYAKRGHTYCCLGKDLAWLADLLKDEGTSHGEVPAQ